MAAPQQQRLVNRKRDERPCQRHCRNTSQSSSSPIDFMTGQNLCRRGSSPTSPASIPSTLVPSYLALCLLATSCLLLNCVGATSIYVVEVEKPTSGAEYAAFTCKGKTGGPFPDPDDCAVYHHCMFGRDFKQNCAAGLRFNPRLLVCDLASKVKNCGPKVKPNATKPPKPDVTSAETTKTTTKKTTTTKTPIESNEIPTREPIEVVTKPKTKAPVVTRSPTTAPATTQVYGAENCPPSGKYIFASPQGCHIYVRCYDGLREVQTCPYPKFFDESTLTCKNWRQVKCGKRPEAKEPCEYRIGAPGEIRAPPCWLTPTCKNKTNNMYADMRRDCRSFYRCEEGRTMELKQCEQDGESSSMTAFGMMFSEKTRQCEDAMLVQFPCGPNLPLGKLGSPRCPPEADGWWGDPFDCRVYHKCSPGNGSGRQQTFVCSPGTVWDQDKKACVLKTAKEEMRCSRVSSYMCDGRTKAALTLDNLD